MSGTAHRRPRLVLAACFLMSVGFNAYLLGPASLIPLLVEEFSIDNATAGLSISAVFLGWTLLQLPGGFLMDRYDNRRLIGAGVAIFVAVSLAAFFAPTYRLFLVTRFFGGAAAVFLWTTNANIVSRSMPASSQAIGTSVFITSAPAGVAIAQFAGPRIAAWGGWRSIFLVYPLLSLAAVPVFYWLLREPVRTESRLGVDTFLRTIRKRSILAISLSSFCAYSLFLFFNSWMPTYANEVLSIELAAAGSVTALIPAAGFLARPGGGWLSERIGGRRRPVIVLAFLLVLVVLAGVPFLSTSLTFAVLLFFAGLGSQLGTGVFYVYVNDLSDDETQGTQLAVLTAVSMAGALFAPAAAGWLIDTVSWTAAFQFAAVLAVAGIVAIMLTPRP